MGGKSFQEALESFFGGKDARPDPPWDACFIRCPCGAWFRVAKGINDEKYAGAAEKFIEAHKAHELAKK